MYDVGSVLFVPVVLLSACCTVIGLAHGTSLWAVLMNAVCGDRTCWNRLWCVYVVIKSVGVVLATICMYSTAVPLAWVDGPLLHSRERRDCVVGQLALRELRNLFTVLCGVWMNQVDIAPMEHNESCLPPGPCSLSHSAHFLLRVSNAFVSPFVIYSKQGGGHNSKGFLNCVNPFFPGAGCEAVMCRTHLVIEN